MNIFTSKERLITRLKYPIAVLSFYLIIVHILSLAFPKLNINIEVFSSLLWSAACGAFVAFCEYKESAKSFAVSFSVLGANAIFLFSTNRPFGLLISVLLTLVIVMLGKNLDFEYLIITSSLLGVFIGLIFGLLDDVLQMYVKDFAYLIKGRAVLFGILNEVYVPFFGNFFTNLVYNSDCSVATVVDGEIVSGVQKIFLASSKIPRASVADYLTGKYFVNIFLALGTVLALIKKTYRRYFFSFSIPCVLSMIFGDNKLLLLFLLFYNPLIFVSFVLVGGIGYFVASLIDIRIGFDEFASVFNLVRYGKNMGYFLLVGFVLAVLIYFVVQIVVAKFDMDNQKYYPKDVRRLVKSLGGEQNIENLENGVLTVCNPNLINILNVDCEIRQNTVILIDNDYNLLKEYF